VKIKAPGDSNLHPGQVVGKEAYDIRIGSKGVPLVGDETRESWPSTYKVRDRKR
jgi:hypothetical protein